MNIITFKKNSGQPHYVEQTVVMNLKKLLDPKVKEFARKNCRDLFFTIVIVCRYIAEQEFMKVYDWYDEHNQIKFLNKKYLEAIKKDFQKYNDYLYGEHGEKSKVSSVRLMQQGLWGYRERTPRLNSYV